MNRPITICDIESTSDEPSNAEILEIYLARLKAGQMIDELHINVRPRFWDSSAKKSVAIHGITYEKAMEGIPWRESMKMIWDFLPEEPEHFLCHANRRMFGRQGCYDWQVLQSHFYDIGFEHCLHFQKMFPAQKIISTHSLAKRFLSIDNNKLDTIARHFNIDLSKHHTAKNDALACWKIFLRLLPLVDNLDQFLEEDYFNLYQSNSDEEKKQKPITTVPMFDPSFTQGEIYVMD